MQDAKRYQEPSLKKLHIREYGLLFHSSLACEVADHLVGHLAGLDKRSLLIPFALYRFHGFGTART